jgi:hypothetical protein
MALPKKTAELRALKFAKGAGGWYAPYKKCQSDY